MLSIPWFSGKRNSAFLGKFSCNPLYWTNLMKLVIHKQTQTNKQNPAPPFLAKSVTQEQWDCWNNAGTWKMELNAMRATKKEKRKKKKTILIGQCESPNLTVFFTGLRQMKAETTRAWFLSLPSLVYFSFANWSVCFQTFIRSSRSFLSLEKHKSYVLPNILLF